MKDHAVRCVRGVVSATGPSRLWLLQQGREVVVATVRQVARLRRYVHAVASTPVLGWRAWLTQSALGCRMYKSGLRDEALRERISAPDEPIDGVKAAKGWTKASGIERARLYHWLAEPVVIQATAPPGDRGDHRRAFDARRRLAEHCTRVAVVRGELASAPASDWWKAGAVCASLGGVALILTMAVGGPRTVSPVPPRLGLSGAGRVETRRAPHDSSALVADADAADAGRAIASDRPDPQQNPNTALRHGSDDADAEAIVSEALRTTSDEYRERGFNQFKFGMSRDEVAAITPLREERDRPGWMRDDKQGFFFADDHLVAPSKRYVGDASTNFAVTEYFELLYRHFKQTFERRKLRSHRAANAEPEAIWSLLGLWAMMPHDQVILSEKGVPPKRISIAGVPLGYRSALREYKSPPDPGESLYEMVGKAVIDPYQRANKSSRDYPRKKQGQAAGAPKVRNATKAEIHAAKEIRDQRESRLAA